MNNEIYERLINYLLNEIEEQKKLIDILFEEKSKLTVKKVCGDKKG